CAPHLVDEIGEVVGARREEAVPDASGATGCALRVSADDDGDATVLHGLRVAPRVREAAEGSVVRLVLGPQSAERVDVLIGAAHALIEGHADRVELFLQPADADAERETPAE